MAMFSGDTVVRNANEDSCRVQVRLFDMYLCTPAVAGYGARIFIHKDGRGAAHELLKKLSCWGGHDKDWNDFWGYEFGAPEYVNCCVYWLQDHLFVEMTAEERMFYL